jgi:hypothetical protein
VVQVGPKPYTDPLELDMDESSQGARTCHGDLTCGHSGSRDCEPVRRHSITETCQFLPRYLDVSTNQYFWHIVIRHDNLLNNPLPLKPVAAQKLVDGGPVVVVKMKMMFALLAEILETGGANVSFRQV